MKFGFGVVLCIPVIPVIKKHHLDLTQWGNEATRCIFMTKFVDFRAFWGAIDYHQKGVIFSQKGYFTPKKARFFR